VWPGRAVHIVLGQRGERAKGAGGGLDRWSTGEVCRCIRIRRLRDSKGSPRGDMVATVLDSPARFGRGEVKGKEEGKLEGSGWSLGQVGCPGKAGQVAHLWSCGFENGKILPIWCLMK
jgi:hypothetical protein